VNINRSFPQRLRGVAGLQRERSVVGDARCVISGFALARGEPEAGAVIKDSGGCRKVRWSRSGTGKSSGVRVIYFTRLAARELCMLLVYPKSVRDTIPGHILRMIRKELEDGFDQDG
jgi:hypothetical protein